TVTSPPPGLRARVLADAARSRQDPPRLHHNGTRGAGRLTRWQRFTATVAAAVALVAGAVGVTHGVEQGRVDSARHSAVAAQAERARIAGVLADPDTRVVPATLPGGGRARVAISPGRNEAVVALSRLPHLTGGRTYQMWLVTGGSAHSAGVLDVGQQDTTHLVVHTGHADAFALSTEPAGGSRQPSGVWASIPLTT
ncbi:MAG: anti-sigma factor, partial [Actinocatenispora sp.]